MVEHLKSSLERNINFPKYFTQVTRRSLMYLKCTKKCAFVGTGIGASTARTAELECVTNRQRKCFNTVGEHTAHPGKLMVDTYLKAHDLKASHSLA